MSLPTTEGFLLTRNWRDTSGGVELEFWFATDNGPVCALLEAQRSLFFLAEPELERAKDLLRSERGVEFKSLELRDFSMAPVAGLYFRSHRALRRSAELLRQHGLAPLEADINQV